MKKNGVNSVIVSPYPQISKTSEYASMPAPSRNKIVSATMSPREAKRKGGPQLGEPLLVARSE